MGCIRLFVECCANTMCFRRQSNANGGGRRHAAAIDLFALKHSGGFFALAQHMQKCLREWISMFMLRQCVCGDCSIWMWIMTELILNSRDMRAVQTAGGYHHFDGHQRHSAQTHSAQKHTPQT